MKHKKLAEQAWLEINDNGVARCDANDLERFAELVRDDERSACAKHYLVVVEQIRKDEREACALLCEEWYLAGAAANAIRARGNK